MYIFYLTFHYCFKVAIFCSWSPSWPSNCSLNYFITLVCYYNCICSLFFIDLCYVWVSFSCLVRSSTYELNFLMIYSWSTFIWLILASYICVCSSIAELWFCFIEFYSSNAAIFSSCYFVALFNWILYSLASISANYIFCFNNDN